MDPNVGLQAASGLVSFLLKTTVEWLVCLTVVRLTTSPRWRFNLWLSMLVAFSAQWFWMWLEVARRSFAAQAVFAGAAKHERILPNEVTVTPQLAREATQILLALFAAYALVLLWRGLGALLGRVRLSRAMQFRRVPGARLASIFAEVIGETQANGRDFSECDLWVLPGIHSPATVRVVRPSILLPLSWETQDDAELRIALWHELKHIQRRDGLWHLLMGACRTVLWFHPAVGHAAEALHAQRELACDAAVVQEHPHSRDVYASCLLRFAQSTQRSALPGLQMAAKPPLLATRVRSILEDAPGTSRFARAGRGVTNLLLLAATVAMVPALNVLFAMQIRLPAAQIPVTNVSADDVVIRARRPVLRKTAVLQFRQHPQTLSTQPANLARWRPHDRALAAEHRTAMGIVTESTGMDVPSPADDRIRMDSTPEPSAHVPVPSSWGTVALDAAERVALLSGRDLDHDGDRH